MLRPMNGHLARKPGRNAKINSTLHYTLICVFIYRYYFMKIFKMDFGIRQFTLVWIHCSIVLKIVLNLSGPLEIVSRKIFIAFPEQFCRNLAVFLIIRTVLKIKEQNCIQKQNGTKQKIDGIYIFLSLYFNYLVI